MHKHRQKQQTPSNTSTSWVGSCLSLPHLLGFHARFAPPDGQPEGHNATRPAAPLSELLAEVQEGVNQHGETRARHLGWQLMPLAQLDPKQVDGEATCRSSNM